MDQKMRKYRCPGCGFSTDKQIFFCPECGTKIPAPSEPVSVSTEAVPDEDALSSLLFEELSEREKAEAADTLENSADASADNISDAPLLQENSSENAPADISASGESAANDTEEDIFALLMGTAAGASAAPAEHMESAASSEAAAETAHTAEASEINPSAAVETKPKPVPAAAPEPVEKASAPEPEIARKTAPVQKAAARTEAAEKRPAARKRLPIKAIAAALLCAALLLTSAALLQRRSDTSDTAAVRSTDFTAAVDSSPASDSSAASDSPAASKDDSAAVCEHQWSEGSCTEPSVCLLCGETGEPAPGHSWLPATCLQPETCSVCGLQQGEAAEHDWMEATTEAPQTCSVCGETVGEPLPQPIYLNDMTVSDSYGKVYYHSWGDADYAYNSKYGDFAVPGHLSTAQDVNGQKYTYGLHMDGNGLGPYWIEFDLGGSYSSLTAVIACSSDAAASKYNSYSKAVSIYCDDVLVYTSAAMTNRKSAEDLTLDVTGVEKLRIVYPANDGPNCIATFYDALLS